MATAYVQRGTKLRSRELPNVEQAAKHLAMLLRMDGYSGDPMSTLLRGERVSHKKFTYWVAY